MVKKTFFLVSVSIVMLGFVSYLSAADEKKLSHMDLFQNKCSKCHETDRAKKLHKSKDNFLEIVKKMQRKEGSGITGQDAKEISEFLGNPSRFLFEAKCTKCHGLDRVIEAHKKGTLTKETIKKMQQKKGSDIQAQEVDPIYEFMNHYYFVPPMPPAAQFPN